MKYIKIYEKFSKEVYLKDKAEKEEELIQSLGDEYIIDIVKDGDFEGLKYLLSTGFDLSECDAVDHLLVVALKNNQMKMFDYLLTSDYANNEDLINSISLPDIIGKKDYNNPNKISKEAVEMLKVITKHGYKFSSANYNLIDLYLTESKWKTDITSRTRRQILIDGVEPFIDWLLEHYPENYKLAKDFLPENLEKKYSYLENTDKYNL